MKLSFKTRPDSIGMHKVSERYTTTIHKESYYNAFYANLRFICHHFVVGGSVDMTINRDERHMA